MNIKKIYACEGIVGVYRGSHLYVLHQVTRDALKFLAERGLRWVERRQIADREQTVDTDVDLARRRYRVRLAIKYLIDAMCYPMLLAATRVITLHDDASNSWQQLCHWRSEEGVLSLFGGVCASLISTALDEAMDYVLAWCIDYCSKDSDVDVADRILLKASGGSVVSVFTTPINYIGVIQRCQSKLPRLPDPEPMLELLKSLPWRGCVYQFAMYGGIMAINVRLVQMKIQLREQMDNDPTTE